MKKNNSAKFDENSMDYAGGVAVGTMGYITNFNADAQARIVGAMTEIAKWVKEEAGVFLGHIKCGIHLEDGTGITLNITDLENGVEVHGVLEPSEKVEFSILCAVLDVDKHELDHMMFHALEDTFLDIEFREGGHSHDHNHGHSHDDDRGCGCGGHSHDDDRGCGCGGHSHDDDRGCGCDGNHRHH
ncbi:MAG: hydrogenase nickel incorporation protein HypA [Candidatus Methanomethylophilaceae archaeon]|jgi:hypothetical protein